MTLSLTIRYKDPVRETSDQPFSFQDVARRCWWPLAEKLRLETLSRIECLVTSDREEAESSLAACGYRVRLSTRLTAGHIPTAPRVPRLSGGCLSRRSQATSRGNPKNSGEKSKSDRGPKVSLKTKEKFENMEPKGQGFAFPAPPAS